MTPMAVAGSLLRITPLPVLLTLALPWLAAADEVEEAIQGDLSPLVVDSERLLDLGLSTAEAKALFEDVHRLLSERLGTDTVGSAELYLGAVLGMLETAELLMLVVSVPSSPFHSFKLPSA